MSLSKGVLFGLFLFLSNIGYSQCEIGSNSNFDATYISPNGFNASVNYGPPSLAGIGSFETWETQIDTDLFSGIRKKYPYYILALTEETTIQLNIGLSVQNLGNGFYLFPNQTIDELTNVMSPDFTSFNYSPPLMPLPRTWVDFFLMDGCPHLEDSQILISSKNINYPVSYMYFENQYGVSRCLSGYIGYIDVKPWNKIISVGLTLPAGEYWVYVGMEIENGVSNWGWVGWSVTQNLTPCNPEVVFPTLQLNTPQSDDTPKFKKVLIMNQSYRGVLLYDTINDKYYDFTYREVFLD